MRPSNNLPAILGIIIRSDARDREARGREARGAERSQGSERRHAHTAHTRPVSPPLTDAAQRVALFRLEPDMHVHMHASNHLLTLTNLGVTGRTLHQPRDLTSPDSHSPACRASQGFRPPEGCRSAAAKRCRSGRGRRRWGGCGGSRWLHARASRRRWRRGFA